MDEDRVIQVLLKQGDAIRELQETVVTKKDHERVVRTLDRLVALAEKNDQEVTVLAHQVKELHQTVEYQAVDIKTMKPLVGLA